MNDRLQAFKKLCSGLDYEIFQDDILMANAAIGSKYYGIELNQCTPTFILKVDDNFIALIIQGSRKINFNKVAAYLGARNATMASENDIFNLTGSSIGNVSLINPNLRTLIDAGVREIQYCFGGCGVKNHTLKINSHDLVKATHAELGDFTQPKTKN